MDKILLRYTEYSDQYKPLTNGDYKKMFGNKATAQAGDQGLSEDREDSEESPKMEESSSSGSAIIAGGPGSQLQQQIQQHALLSQNNLILEPSQQHVRTEQPLQQLDQNLTPRTVNSFLQATMPSGTTTPSTNVPGGGKIPYYQQSFYPNTKYQVQTPTVLPPQQSSFVGMSPTSMAGITPSPGSSTGPPTSLSSSLQQQLQQVITSGASSSQQPQENSNPILTSSLSPPAPIPPQQKKMKKPSLSVEIPERNTINLPIQQIVPQQVTPQNTTPLNINTSTSLSSIPSTGSFFVSYPQTTDTPTTSSFSSWPAWNNSATPAALKQPVLMSLTPLNNQGPTLESSTPNQNSGLKDSLLTPSVDSTLNLNQGNQRSVSMENNKGDNFRKRKVDGTNDDLLGFDASTFGTHDGGMETRHENITQSTQHQSQQQHHQHGNTQEEGAGHSEQTSQTQHEPREDDVTTSINDETYVASIIKED